MYHHHNPILAVKTAKFSTFVQSPFPASSSLPLVHTVHTSKHPAYPARSQVHQVDWRVEDPGYSPVNFTHPAVLDNDSSVKPGGWADPAKWTPELAREIASTRPSHSLQRDGPILFGENTRPKNPMGRTGMCGRGLLGKYGPNYAADPLVTRFDPSHPGVLQMVAIQRADTKQWAIPGGMVDAGEQVSLTLKREFMEEARNLGNAQEEELVKHKLEELFVSGGRFVYCGYVDDPRNTDEAWMETTCVHFHIEDDYLAKHLQLVGGDDALKAKWLEVNDANPDFKNLYASHHQLVVQALHQNPALFGQTIAKVEL